MFAPMNRTSPSRYSRHAASRSRASVLHGGHVDDQKLMTTTLPRCCDSVTSPSLNNSNRKSGASLPTRVIPLRPVTEGLFNRPHARRPMIPAITSEPATTMLMRSVTLKAGRSSMADPPRRGNPCGCPPILPLCALRALCGESPAYSAISTTSTSAAVTKTRSEYSYCGQQDTSVMSFSPESDTANSLAWTTSVR